MIPLLLLVYTPMTVRGHGWQARLGIRRATPEEARSGLWGGPETAGGPPPRIVGEFVVRRGWERVFLPRSAYADLANVSGGSWGKNGTSFVLRLSGGDAASSWRGTFLFSGGYLRERTVVSGEFPEEHRERTVYTNETPKEGPG